MAEKQQLDFFSKKKESLKILGSYLFFDTETTGLPRNWNAPVDDLDNWPRLVQLAWEFYKDGVKISVGNYIIKPEGFWIPAETSSIHGITTERAEREGTDLQTVLEEFKNLVAKSDFLVAHNISFDEKIIGAEFLRKNIQNNIDEKNKICTKEIATDFCAIPNTNGRTSFKWPKLSELHIKLFGIEFKDSHNAMADVTATSKCFFEMKNRNII
jgi:DNA polymerase III epsilon subunit-like protein